MSLRPVYTVLDDFNRANGSLGASWHASSDLTISSNTAAASGGYRGGWYNTTYSAVQFSFVDIATISANVNSVADVWVWDTSPGAYTDQIYCEYNRTAQTFDLHNIIGGVDSRLAISTGGVYVAAVGDTIGISITATGVVSGWLRKSGSPHWIRTITATTAVSPPASSYAGFGSNRDWAFDNWGGGNAVVLASGLAMAGVGA